MMEGLAAGAFAPLEAQTAALVEGLRRSVVLITSDQGHGSGVIWARDGLIVTNHHCVEACLAELSSKDKSFVETGFVSRSRKDEPRCATQVADVLQAMEDVTGKVSKAIAGLDETAANETRKKTLTQLEQACEKQSKLKCEAVTLYQGGQYFLYKYQRYDDVRLVLAPEADIASFGGDPDNFQFPRWSLDFSMLRAYENGKPAKTADFLPIRFAGPDAGELVLVSGHPGSTARLETSAELRFQRDLAWPVWLLRYSELRGRYIEFGKTSEAAARIVEAPLNSLENGIKVRRKLLDALHEDSLLEGKVAAEQALRAKMAGDAAFGDPWADIAGATNIERGLYLPYLFLEGAGGFNSATFRYARTLVRAAAERDKPNAERLREYSETALPRVAQQTLAEVPVYPELENLTLSFSLERMREWLGPDHPVVRQLLAKDSPDQLAASLVAGTKLADPAVRRQLWEGGAAAIAASGDPMIRLAIAVDGASRAVRKRYEDAVEAPIAAAAERIAAARFKAYGTNVYPDATFTLRLNYGTVAGWNEAGSEIAPFTRLATAFERGPGAAKRNVQQRDLGAIGEPTAGEMRRGARTSRRERQRAGLLARKANELWDRACCDARMHDDDERRREHQADRREVAFGVVRQLPINGRADRKRAGVADRERVAVGRRTH